MSSIKYKIWMLLPLMAMISCESILDKFPEIKLHRKHSLQTENEVRIVFKQFLCRLYFR